MQQSLEREDQDRGGDQEQIEERYRQKSATDTFERGARERRGRDVDDRPHERHAGEQPHGERSPQAPALPKTHARPTAGGGVEPKRTPRFTEAIEMRDRVIRAPKGGERRGAAEPSPSARLSGVFARGVGKSQGGHRGTPTRDRPQERTTAVV